MSSFPKDLLEKSQKAKDAPRNKSYKAVWSTSPEVTSDNSQLSSKEMSYKITKTHPGNIQPFYNTSATSNKLSEPQFPDLENEVN